MTALTSHLSAAELEARYEAAADPVSKSHFHAIWLLSSGYAITEAAAILSFSARWVRLLRKRCPQAHRVDLSEGRARSYDKRRKSLRRSVVSTSRVVIGPIGRKLPSGLLAAASLP